MDRELEWAVRLLVALAVGALVGLERGWKARDADEGERELGLRTLAVIGLLGGVCGLLSDQLGELFLGLVFIGMVVLLAVIYRTKVAERGDIGATTQFAALLTFALAALAGRGHLVIAAAGGVVTALLLGYKGRLHEWLGRLERRELEAAIQLLLISVVLLPLLPDRGYGPWEALNPYVIWWMVVLIAAISFVGYFAIRIVGARAGTLATAVFGGLASSTATTLSLSRIGRGKRSAAPLLAGGILLACGTMFPRMVLVATVIHPALFAPLLWPAAVMAAVIYGGALLMMFGSTGDLDSDDVLPRNPLELGSALTFGALLAAVMLAGKALAEWFGDLGIYVLAAASGIADVDAITLSLTKMSQQDLALEVAAVGIVIAASVNSLVKAGLAVGVGGRALGWRVAVPMLIAVIAGLAIVLFRA